MVILERQHQLNGGVTFRGKRGGVGRVPQMDVGRVIVLLIKMSEILENTPSEAPKSVIPML